MIMAMFQFQRAKLEMDHNFPILLWKCDHLLKGVPILSLLPKILASFPSIKCSCFETLLITFLWSDICTKPAVTSEELLRASNNSVPSRLWFVCVFLQVDEGGSKRFFQNKWTSFLKARLICGFPEESLYFNRLQDIFVMHAEDWRDSRIYALFTSSWFDTFPSLVICN